MSHVVRFQPVELEITNAQHMYLACRAINAVCFYNPVGQNSEILWRASETATITK